MTIEKDLLEILACPESHARLVSFDDTAGSWLVSTDAATRRRYRISDDGIPIMLVDESEVLAEDAWRSIMSSCGVE